MKPLHYCILFLVVFVLNSKSINYSSQKLVLSNSQFLNYFVKVNSNETCTIIGNGVRMRATPSLNGNIVGVFKNLEEVTLIVWSNNWAKVKTQKGKICWVFGDFIECGGC
jgi:uncharacterized protein YgiM (DUF1202 family)